MDWISWYFYFTALFLSSNSDAAQRHRNCSGMKQIWFLLLQARLGVLTKKSSYWLLFEQQKTTMKQNFMNECKTYRAEKLTGCYKPLTTRDLCLYQSFAYQQMYREAPIWQLLSLDLISPHPVIHFHLPCVSSLLCFLQLLLHSQDQIQDQSGHLQHHPPHLHLQILPDFLLHSHYLLPLLPPPLLPLLPPPHFQY